MCSKSVEITDFSKLISRSLLSTVATVALVFKSWPPPKRRAPNWPRGLLRRILSEPWLRISQEHELLKFGISTRVIFRLDLDLTAVMKSLVQHSKNFNSSYSVSFQEACIANAAKHLVSWGSVQSAVNSSFRRYARDIERMPRFSKALTLVERYSTNRRVEI